MRKAHLITSDHRTTNWNEMLKLVDFFCGAGGSSQGAHVVPWVEVSFAANHWELAVKSHATNFPSTDHLVADIAQVDMRRLPAGDLLWASPECTNHSIARGRSRTDAQPDLFGETLPDAAAERSRATMWDVPRYLEELILRGRPAKGFVVENVVDARDWVMWPAWLMALESLGYAYQVVYLNSMFAQARSSLWAPQSRDRLYVVGWLRKLGRRPDFGKWLRPRAYCATCDKWVDAVQAWKDPSKPYGRYGRQYVYRCPSATCRNADVHPPVLPAAAAIDWSLPAQRIGDRKRPLAAKTLKRIEAGLARHYRVPLLTPAGGTWNNTAYPVSQVMRTRTTRDAEGVAIPPLLIPMEGREGKSAWPVTRPLRTQTTRNETGLAMLPGQRAPFMVEMRGGGSDHRAIFEPLATVCANGNHHGLALPPNCRGALLVPYYRTGVAHPVTRPMGTVTTHDRHGLATYEADEIAVEDCEFRMLEPEEIGSGMAFADDYQVLGNKRERVRQYGNAVTPPAAEVLVSALVEAIVNEPIERFEFDAA